MSQRPKPPKLIKDVKTRFYSLAFIGEIEKKKNNIIRIGCKIHTEQDWKKIFSKNGHKDFGDYRDETDDYERCRTAFKACQLILKGF